MSVDPIEIAVPMIHATAFVAPTAQIHGAVILGPSTVVMFGAVLRAEFERIEVGAESNVQDNVVFHTDIDRPCIIGRRVTVGHAAVVHGATVGDHCLIGIRATVLNGADVGEGAWVAAGSLVPEGVVIPPWTLAVGTPARPRRELTEGEIRRQAEGVDHYLAFGKAYRAVL